MARHGETTLSPPAAEPPAAPPDFPPIQPAVSLPTGLAQHFEILVRALLQGRVIPFLGAGVNIAGRSAGAAWAPGSYLPTGAELAQHIAAQFNFPADVETDLARVAQYGDLVAGPAALYSALREVFDVDYPPTPVHLLLAALPETLRRHGEGDRPLVVATANFDDVLERAFDARDEPYDIVRYNVARTREPGSWMHIPSGGEPVVILTPKQYEGISRHATVILKLHGSVDRADETGDSYMITEDDYLAEVARADLSARLPVTLLARLRRSHWLFLGYSVRDWNLRLMLDQILGAPQARYRSWAVVRNPDRIDQLLWQARDVDLVDTSLGDYVGELHARLETAWS